MENSVTQGSFSRNIYRPLAVLAYPSMALFGCLAAMSLFLAVLGFSYALFHRDPYSPEESGSMSIVFQLMALFLYLEPFARVLTIIVFLAWVFRAHKNLSGLKVRGLEYTPGWAVGLWLIPFVNFVKPFQIMREIWHGSDPENEDNNKHTRAQKETPEILGFWWGVLLAAIFTGYIANIMAGSKTIEENTFYPAALVLSTLLRFAAFVLIILIIKEITRRQELRFQNLAGVSSRSDAFPPPPPTFGEDI